jgi:hypothetical protein
MAGDGLGGQVPQWLAFRAPLLVQDWALFGTVFAMTTEPTRLDRAIDARRKELRLRWSDVATRADVAYETLRQIRRGLRDTAERQTDSERKIERALGWAPGSIQAIRDGGEARLLGPAPEPTPTPAEREWPAFVGTDRFKQYVWLFEDAPEDERRGAIHGIDFVRTSKEQARAEGRYDERRA